MPAYEYQCESCNNRFETRQKMSDSAIETCPRCGGHVRRLISGGAGAITRGASTSSYAAAPSCGMGGPCCRQGAGCMGGDGACEF